jgi:CubicO group peptidase (beta-lactamase class C family)
MRKFPAALALLCVMAAVGLRGQQPPVFTPYGALPVLDAYLESLRQQAAIPGMSAAVVRDGTVIWEKGYGFQNTAARIRATPDTPYLVGDLSGTLGAMMVLRCAEERHVDLDQPIRKYGAELPEPTVTVRDVLSHIAPGAEEPFAYSPERFAHLTGIVERCQEQSYRKGVADLLDQSAMRDSVPGIDFWRSDQPLQEEEFDEEDVLRYRQVLDRMAVPYRVDTRGRAERTDLPTIAISAAGGLVTTVRDLARLDATLDSGVILRQETLDAAWNNVVTPFGFVSPMGLGWFVQGYRSERVVWHFGMNPGAYSSLMVKLPDRKLTFILLANSDGLNATFQLPSGNVARSLFASLFLRLVT